MAREIFTLRAAFLIIAICTLILIGLGGFVRATGAGLSCPDWPLCYGRVVPQIFHPGVAQEYIHRLAAGTVTLLIVGISFYAWKVRARLPRLWSLSRILLLILSSQIILGGLTVLMRLNPFIVMAHLFFGSLVFVLVASSALEGRFILCKARYAGVLLLLVMVQVLLGGFVASSGASLACLDIPFCEGKFLPSGASSQQILQMTHRSVGGLILFIAGILTLISSRQERKWFLTISLILLLQIALGLLNVVWRIPIPIALAHLIVAELLLLTVACLYKACNSEANIFD